MKKPFKETRLGKFLAKKGTQRVIHGVIGEIPLVGRALAGVLTPTPTGEFNFQPDWKRTGITMAFGVVLAILINKGVITKEGLESVIEVLMQLFGSSEG